MCYKETLYYGKCGCYGKPQLVGEPCIRVEANPTLRSTGCWDVVDLGVKSTNSMCRRCEVAERNSSTTGSMSASSGSGSSRSGSSEEGRGGKESSRAQASVSLSGMATYKLRREDGTIDRSTTAFQAFHDTDSNYWTSQSHKTPYVDRMYSLGLPGKVTKLDSSQE